MSEIFMPLILALLGALGAWITKTLIPYIKSRTDLASQEKINNWVKTAVTAAEQLFTGTGYGQKKLEYARSFLCVLGIFGDETKIRAMIESAVQRMKAGVL